MLPGALCVWEEAKAAHVTVPRHFTLIDERSFGISVVRLMVYDKN
jgi:16S rRNA G966 N2-methylase RsmD